MSKFIFFAFSVFTTFALCSAASNDLVVQVANGKVRGVKQVGFEGNTVHSFMSIPYAKPPVGPLRFRPPEPAENWDGIRDATKYGPTCIQTPLPGIDLQSSPFQKEYMDEDCLTLDVHVPAKVKQNKPMAVMVWIHGGGFYIGYGQLVDGENAATNYTLLNKDVIVVGMNYRLGPLGFLSTGDENALGNWGLRDQALALAWVKNNIAAFGGDPQRVTIFGISAGGMSVSAQLLSPYSKNLFNRGIAQSGVMFNMMLNSNPLSDARRLARSVNCSEQQTDKFVECLRQIPAKTIVDALNIFEPETDNPIPYQFSPVIDGDFFPKGPELMERNLADKELMVGFIEEEGHVFPGNYFLPNLPEDFITVHPSITQSDFDQAVSRFAQINKLEDFYGINQCVLNKITDAIKFTYTDWGNATDGHRRYEMVVKLWGHFYFDIPAIQVLKYRDSSNGTASTYLYRWTIKTTEELFRDILFYAPKWLEKATHGEDMFYMFTPLLPSYSKNDRKVSEDIVTYWTNFAKTGNPNNPSLRPGMVTWETYRSGSEKHLEIAQSPILRSDINLDQLFIHFWTEYVPKIIESADCGKNANDDSLLIIAYLKENIIFVLILTPLTLILVRYFTRS